MVSRADFDLYLITDRGRIAPQSYDGIVKLLPGEDFSIVAQNKSCLKIKAGFYMSGEYIGTLVIPKFERCEIKRPILGIDRRFRYCEFGSNDSRLGKLYEHNLHSDEITVIFSPEKPSKPSSVGAACADGIVGGFNSYKGLKIETDYATAGGNRYDTLQRGGTVLGPNVSHQKFFEVPNFDTHGEYYFTLILRTKETIRSPKIIPLSDMHKYN